jgi:pyruvate dehydrogenase E1 component
MKRHLNFDNAGRSGVLVRGVTRGIEQKDMLKFLRRQKRFKVGADNAYNLTLEGHDYPGSKNEKTINCLSDTDILNHIREEVLAGAYYLINFEGYYGYEPGDNVVNIFAMGSLCTEAIEASNRLLEIGIYANVIVVTSPDLLVGNLGAENDFEYIKKGLKVNSDLFLLPQLNGHPQGSEIVTLAGRRVPAVSVHDGEPGLLDNIGSIIGVKHESLAVRKHSKCGRPSDIYKFHGIDADSVAEACKKVLAETALEQVQVSRRALGEAQPQIRNVNWQELWPKMNRQ